MRSAAVGPRLRALRQERETTLADLSAETGISVSTLSRLESGTPGADPRAAAAAGPGPPGEPRRARRRPADRRSARHAAARHRARHDDAAAHAGAPRASRPSRSSSRPGSGATPISRPTRATSGSTCSTVDCGCCWPTTTWCSSRGRRPSSTPAYAALVRAGRRGGGGVPQPVRQAGGADAPARPAEAPSLIGAPPPRTPVRGVASKAAISSRDRVTRGDEHVRAGDPGAGRRRGGGEGPAREVEDRPGARRRRAGSAARGA